MPAKNPRVNVVLERPMYTTLARLARRDGTSLSVKARDLLREALEGHEDLVLARRAESRERTFDRSRSLSHAEVWKAVKTRPRR
jgi:transcriptional antiterminator Rof (Rho-off)